MGTTTAARLGAGPWAMERAAFQSFKARLASLPVELTPSSFLPSSKGEVSKPYAVHNGIAVLDVQGVILQSDTSLNRFYAYYLGGCITEQLSADFSQALADEDVQKILLRVNSPGGEAMGMAAFAQKVYEARGIKDVIAHVNGYNCSGGYYFSSACSAVFADKGGCWHGNVGSLINLYNEDGFLEQLGIVETEIVSEISPDKSPDETTEEGYALWQSTISALGLEFAGDVATFRGLSGAEQVKEQFGNGWVKTSQEALEAGMIDGICSLDFLLGALSKGQTASQIKGSLPNNGLLSQAQNTIMGLLSFMHNGKEQQVEVVVPSEDAQAVASAPTAEAPATPPAAPATPNAEVETLKKQLLDSHTKQAAQFASGVVSGLALGGDNRTEAETAISSLYLCALQGTAPTAEAVEAAFGVFPKSTLGATLPDATLTNAQSAKEETPPDPNAVDQDARKKALSSFPKGQHALETGAVAL